MTGETQLREQLARTEAELASARERLAKAAPIIAGIASMEAWTQGLHPSSQAFMSMAGPMQFLTVAQVHEAAQLAAEMEGEH